MPCDTRIPQGMTATQREEQIKQAIAELEGLLGNRSVQMQIGSNGAVLFNGWNNRAGINDACAFLALQVKNSFAFQTALAEAEAMAGRQVNQMAVGSGMHSHDGGHTWGTH